MNGFNLCLLRCKKRRRGITVVELLVVLAVIGLLVALIVPAIQSVRESSRQTQCRNHLRQIGVALHSYLSTHRSFPLASITGPLEGMGTRGLHDGFGWGTFILPHLDQAALYHQIDPQGQIGIIKDYYDQHGTIIPGGESRLEVYRCPSSILPDISTNLGPGTPRSANFLGYGTSDYKGCAGHRHTGRGGVFVPANSCGTQCAIEPADVRDGASTTIMVGESSTPTWGGRAWPLWIGTPGAQQSVVFDSFESRFSEGLNYGITNKGLSTQFWTKFESRSPAFSYHPGGVNFLFVDGSTKFLSDNIDAQTYYALTGRNDGIVVGEF